MGGYSSGRHHYAGAHHTTRDYRSIDVRQWQRKMLLQSAQTFTRSWIRHGKVEARVQVTCEEESVVLEYRDCDSGNSGLSVTHRVRLEWTACHMGGTRPWFLCPLESCDRRVAILYVRKGRFACRRCYRLAYPSQRESYDDLALRKANRIRDRLGWIPGIAFGTGQRPKGMHRKTYRRLRQEYIACLDIFLPAQERRLMATQEGLVGLAKRLGVDLRAL